MTLNITEIRKDFPILEREVRPGVRLTYLDSTATSQKPLAVIQAMDDFYRKSNANIHRGVHTLAEEATTLYESARERIAKFINAASARQIIYTRNATESINLVAYSWARANLKQGDLVILTEMEHHSNLVPWHILQAERGIELESLQVRSHAEPSVHGIRREDGGPGPGPADDGLLQVVLDSNSCDVCSGGSASPSFLRAG